MSTSNPCKTNDHNETGATRRRTSQNTRRRFVKLTEGWAGTRCVGHVFAGSRLSWICLHSVMRVHWVLRRPRELNWGCPCISRSEYRCSIGIASVGSEQALAMDMSQLISDATQVHITYLHAQYTPYIPNVFVNPLSELIRTETFINHPSLSIFAIIHECRLLRVVLEYPIGTFVLRMEGRHAHHSPRRNYTRHLRHLRSHNPNHPS